MQTATASVLYLAGSDRPCFELREPGELKVRVIEGTLFYNLSGSWHVSAANTPQERRRVIAKVHKILREEKSKI